MTWIPGAAIHLTPFLISHLTSCLPFTLCIPTLKALPRKHPGLRENGRISRWWKLVELSLLTKGISKATTRRKDTGEGRATCCSHYIQMQAREDGGWEL